MNSQPQYWMTVGNEMVTITIAKCKLTHHHAYGLTRSNIKALQTILRAQQTTNNKQLQSNQIKSIGNTHLKLNIRLHLVKHGGDRDMQVIKFQTTQ